MSRNINCKYIRKQIIDRAREKSQGLEGYLRKIKTHNRLRHRDDMWEMMQKEKERPDSEEPGVEELDLYSGGESKMTVVR